MKVLDRHTIELLRHSVANFVVTLVLTLFAIALDLLEHWCARNGVSDWLVTGIGVMSKITYIFDGVLFLATAAMVGAHFLREMFSRFFRR